MTSQWICPENALSGCLSSNRMVMWAQPGCSFQAWRVPPSGLSVWRPNHCIKKKYDTLGERAIQALLLGGYLHPDLSRWLKTLASVELANEALSDEAIFSIGAATNASCITDPECFRQPENSLPSLSGTPPCGAFGLLMTHSASSATVHSARKCTPTVYKRGLYFHMKRAYFPFSIVFFGPIMYQVSNF